jgi:antimicrobial peptide system SdpA family protein
MLASGSPPASLRVAGATLLCLGTAWGIAIAYSFHSALPYNPLVLPAEDQIRLELWLPQGWGFFTRDPREPDVRVLRKQGGGSWEFVTPDDRRWLGFNRVARAQGFELNDLIQQLPAGQWLECDRDPLACVEDASGAARARNHASSPTLCGPIAFLLQEPVPWAWRSSSVVMPSRLLRVDVQC